MNSDGVVLPDRGTMETYILQKIHMIDFHDRWHIYSYLDISEESDVDLSITAKLVGLSLYGVVRVYTFVRKSYDKLLAKLNIN